MPDVKEEKDEKVTEPEPEPEVKPAGEGEGEPEPHPLEPGGKRFGEVYSRLKDSERTNTELRERLARLEGRAEATEPKKPQEPTFYTAAQLQAAVDAGRITPALMADQLSWQRKEEAKRELRNEFEYKQRATVALTEVNTYVEKIPALRNTGSEEFAKAARAAREISDEMGYPPDDPRVMRRALREAFGPIDKLTDAKRAREFDRRNADTHAETGRGVVKDGGTKPDPLKNVPSHYLEHWKRLGYTPERMKEEAAYIRPRQRR